MNNIEENKVPNKLSTQNTSSQDDIDLDEDDYLDDERQRKPKGKRLHKFRSPKE